MRSQKETLELELQMARTGWRYEVTTAELDALGGGCCKGGGMKRLKRMYKRSKPEMANCSNLV